MFRLVLNFGFGWSSCLKRTLDELKGLVTFGDRSAGSPPGTRRTSLAAYKAREATLADSVL